MKSADGKHIMGAGLNGDYDLDVWERFLLKNKSSSSSSSSNSNNNSLKDEFRRNYIVITKSEDFVRLFPNGGTFSDFIFESQPNLHCGGSICRKLQDLVDSNPKFEIQGLSTIQSGKVYDTGSIEVVNVPEGVEIPFLPKLDPPIVAQFAGGRQARFVPEGDPFYIFHGVCVATSGIVTPPRTITNLGVNGKGPTMTTVIPQPIITKESCKLNLCLGGGGFDCIFIYSGTAFAFNLGEGIIRNNDAKVAGGGVVYTGRHNRALQDGTPATFESPPLPPPYPGTIIGGTGSFEGIEGTVNIATVAGTTGLLLNNWNANTKGGLFQGIVTRQLGPDDAPEYAFSFPPIGNMVQVLSVVSNMPLPPAP